MKYLLIAVLLWGCTGDLQLQGKRHPLGVYSEGKLIGYGQLEPEKMYLGEGITAGPPHILIADARPFICILTDTNRYPIDSKWISAFLKASENYLYMDMRSKPPEPCKHIYVATYRDSVEYSCRIRVHYMMDHFDLGLGYTPPAAGTHTADHDEKNMAEGINLVCVKCFHQTRQKIHYKHKETSTGFFRAEGILQLPDDTTRLGYDSPATFVIDSGGVQIRIGDGGGGTAEFDSTIGRGTPRLTSPVHIWYIDSLGEVHTKPQKTKTMTNYKCTCAGGLPHVH